MSTEENKSIVQRLVEEGWNQGHLAIFDRYVAPTRVWHEPSGRDAGSPELHKRFVAAVRAAFPDGRYRVADQVAEGDRVVTRVEGRGTHQGAFEGIPASGGSVSLSAILIDRLAQGQIVETWALLDDLGLLRQVGALAPAEPAGRAAGVDEGLGHR